MLLDIRAVPSLAAGSNCCRALSSLHNKKFRAILALLDDLLARLISLQLEPISQQCDILIVESLKEFGAPKAVRSHVVLCDTVPNNNVCVGLTIQLCQNTRLFCYDRHRSHGTPEHCYLSEKSAGIHSRQPLSPRNFILQIR